MLRHGEVQAKGRVLSSRRLNQRERLPGRLQGHDTTYDITVATPLTELNEVGHGEPLPPEFAHLSPERQQIRLREAAPRIRVLHADWLRSTEAGVHATSFHVRRKEHPKSTSEDFERRELRDCAEDAEDPRCYC